MEKFEFDLDGKTYKLPRTFPFKVWRQLTGLDFVSQLGVLLEHAAAKDADAKAALAALDELEPIEVVRTLKGWLGASPGESSESSKS